MTRKALLEYVASDDPWLTPSPGFAMNALTFLLSIAVEDETQFVRPLRLHAVPEERLRPYTFLAQAAMENRGPRLLGHMASLAFEKIEQRTMRPTAGCGWWII